MLRGSTKELCDEDEKEFRETFPLRQPPGCSRHRMLKEKRPGDPDAKSARNGTIAGPDFLTAGGAITNPSEGEEFEMMQRFGNWEVSRACMARVAFVLMGWLIFLSQPSWSQTVTVVNAASFRSDQPVSAGSWVSGFGTFDNVAENEADSLPLSTSLGGVTITVAGVSAPIRYVGPLQVNFVIPYETAPGLHPVVVTGPGGTVNGTVRVISTAPGIFKDNNDPATPPQGAILNQDDSYNAEDRPAIGGQAVQLFATGHSTLNGAIGNGAAGPTPNITTQGLPQVFVGGVECAVEFSGLAAGFAALWQINVRIPQLPFLQGKLPLQIFMNGVDSNEVTIYVAQ